MVFILFCMIFFIYKR